MFVKNHILEKHRLTLLSVNNTVKEAIDRMEQGKFLSLPVVDGEKFVGYVMKDSIFDKYYHEEIQNKSEFESQSIEKFIITNYRRLDPNDSIDSASVAIEKLNIPFLPVINSDDVFLGIITHAAVFKAFAELFNLGIGKQLTVYIFNIPGQLSRLMNVFRKEDVNVQNMVVMDAKVMGILKVIARVEVDDLADLIAKVEKEGFKTGTL